MAQTQRSVTIPDKLYFKIGEVSELLNLEPYVLRYWETEFKDISPVKSRTNQRLYKKKDVELLLKIKKYLYEERFTIDGARKRLKSEKGRVEVEAEKSQLGLGIIPSEKESSWQLLSDSIKSELAQLKDRIVQNIPK
ncbi:MAG TPA: MerR family transcriptional regulator [Deltaproteobacteria bacterium]|nr:MAG: hypothetical protein A2048_02800 [Deltaproteobacteria bacterium GWA2_45_12]HBF12240.1 MerR family transcriptional regulator [Deltaproteobacteria bacterium]